RHLQRDAEVGFALLGDLVDVRHAGAELAQDDVLVVLRPDGRRTHYAADGGDAGALEQPAATNAEFASHVPLLLLVSPLIATLIAQGHARPRASTTASPPGPAPPAPHRSAPRARWPTGSPVRRRRRPPARSCR